MRVAMAEMMRTFSEPSSHAVVVVWCDLCSKRCAFPNPSAFASKSPARCESLYGVRMQALNEQIWRLNFLSSCNVV